MTIGSITPTVTPTASLLSALGSSGQVATTGAATAVAASGVADRGTGLFSSILRDELQAVAGELSQPAAPASAASTEPASGTGTAHAVAATAPATSAFSAAATSSATTTGAISAAAASPTVKASTGTGTAAATATTDATTPGHRYVVTYVHGQQAVSSGQTPAPLVKGPTGGLVITAKTTGLTQLTRRFTGTVGHPTAAAEATAATMAVIASLKAAGQA